MHHDLKTWPQYFQRVMSGQKTFELRQNDRGYQPGDTVTLKEFDPEVTSKLKSTKGKFTGHELQRTIGYVMPIGDGTHVVFSLLKTNEGE